MIAKLANYNSCSKCLELLPMCQIADYWTVMDNVSKSRAVFLAEANQIGYLPTGVPIESNELYALNEDGVNVALDGMDTILGEYYAFGASPSSYAGRLQPDCMAISFAGLWNSHESRRIDPKYHLFKRQESSHVPDGWVTARIGNVMRRRLDEIHPEHSPERLGQGNDPLSRWRDQDTRSWERTQSP